MARIALFGATGMIGSRILGEALDRGHDVLAVVRDPSRLTTAHPALRLVTGNVLEPSSVLSAADGQDVVVSAVGGGHGDAAGHLATAEPGTRALVAGLRALGRGVAGPRLISVGGAGPLRTSDGKLLWDTEGLPGPLLQIMHAHGDALDYIRTVSDVRWTVISPSALVGPGSRTGTYRSALDDLIVGEDGKSRISTEDFAVAVVDEIEHARHLDSRFTVGY
ncbi:NAD(P)H-binding protein [Streptomyces malaysiensis subsp. malaysiensis]|uniref:NAD(P)H-binding protein n=1 Tax=Streptomyces malaysiensis TaxID=92644 RepID=A0ABX6WLF7_STRMQ|nr:MULTISPECIES: NAD(P)H-binding protein [Streptomyces]QPI62294.1 NAD(P)H-binding protein [Streptomyces solisilvae]UHH23075.1 NAD(P)H-binding protein [Streptomyces sp. HNM0561]